MFSQRDESRAEHRGVDGSGELNVPAPRLRRHPRRREEESDDRGGRETILGLIRDIPSFLKLLYRLAIDPRVSRLDRGILLATVGYILLPMDLIPDFIPFLGQVDDIYLLALTLNRLLSNTGMDILLEHWDGEVANLEAAISALGEAASFLPGPIRAALHRRVE